MTTLPKTDRQNIAEQLAQRIYCAMIDSTPNYHRLLPRSQQIPNHIVLKDLINIMELVEVGSKTLRSNFSIFVRDSRSILSDANYPATSDELKVIANLALELLFHKFQCNPISDAKFSMMEAEGIKVLEVNCLKTSRLDNLIRAVTEVNQGRWIN